MVYMNGLYIWFIRMVYMNGVYEWFI